MHTLAVIENALRSNRRLARVLAHIHRDSSQPLSLAQAARIAGLERTYFSSYFQTITGVTFRQWNRLHRIELAKHLLRTSQLAINSIALSVGYEDVTTFERNFRKCASVSPRLWRRKDSQDSPINPQ